jgi:hypothetical protein
MNDYLIDQHGKDWPHILSCWAGTIPESFTLWLVNRFGEAFLVLDDGSVQMLDLGGGSLTRLAESRVDFARLLDVRNNSRDWLMIPLVDDCVRSLPPLQPSQCYRFKIPPMLGGECCIENVQTSDLTVYHSPSADILAQTKDLPDGTRSRP